MDYICGRVFGTSEVGRKRMFAAGECALNELQRVMIFIHHEFYCFFFKKMNHFERQSDWGQDAKIEC